MFKTEICYEIEHKKSAQLDYTDPLIKNLLK